MDTAGFWGAVAGAVVTGGAVTAFVQGMIGNRRLAMKLANERAEKDAQRDQVEADRLWKQLDADRAFNALERDKTSREIGALQQQVKDLRTGISTRDAKIAQLSRLIVEKDETIGRLRLDRDEQKARADAAEARLTNPAGSMVHPPSEKLAAVAEAIAAPKPPLSRRKRPETPNK